MKRLILLILAILVLYSVNSWADDCSFSDIFDEEEDESVEIFDPIEPVNNIFFLLNGFFYKGLLKPTSKVYETILPKVVRNSLGKACANLKAPIRIINNVLQGNLDGAGREIERFIINSTIGLAGLTDPAKTEFGIDKSDEDFGTTLAHWGVADGFYLVLPIFGPKTMRDGMGLVGDIFLFYQPYCHYVDGNEMAMFYGESVINETSLRDPYGAIIKNSVMPYVALRYAYYQYRNAKIKK